MRVGRRARQLLLTGFAVAALAACEILPNEPTPPEDIPQVAPTRPRAAPQPAPSPTTGIDTTPAPSTAPRSAASRELAAYYGRLQQDLLVQGLLRTDGGGPDTPFTDTMLVRNFERIALAEEYARGAGFTRSSGELGRVKKWNGPVRISVDFGASVDADQRITDQAQVARYVARLARVTRHPVSISQSNANFHVLFMGEDDSDQLKPRIRALVPEISDSALSIFDNLPRGIHCLVLAFSGSPNGYDYARAVALIRAEHPDLLRQSCIHEELAQGLGLGNDSPTARPSIFNDDDEFALLTTHDEMLLKILYDPRLKPGMSADQARPIVRELAARMTGGPS
ncbi:DUF2927 family protein [Primorskyibacter sedentarius]|uniref:DUF2927 family protein n=1 Tax=Primorskyibacter sedentarius TaxID=745311 RepID=A0A4R3JMG9_9RHOB|nr:DUF2927 domain-containing protein [Primorskyibacter sedentarius]TCS67577.1 DUF2927 family protein [Primorskyibacter sedentarius]